MVAHVELQARSHQGWAMPDPRSQAVADEERNRAEFAARLKAWREHKGVSVRQLAFWADKSDDSIRNYESGRTSPELKTMCLLAYGLDVPLRDLLFADPGQPAAAVPVADDAQPSPSKRRKTH